MRFRVVSFLVFFVLSLFLSTPGVHAAVPARPLLHVNCHNDQCDGFLPHDTDGSGGSNCLSGFTEPVSSVALKDKDGRTEGTLHFYQSYQCNAAWATVHADTTYMNEVTINTVRLHQSYPTPGDDDRTFWIHWSWPDYVTGQWLDGQLAGFEQYENPPNNDCLHGWAHWQDRYGTWHDTNTADWCI